MNTWIKIRYNRTFLAVLFGLIALNVLATISENQMLIQITKPLFVPLFLIYFYVKNKYIHTVFVFFLLFSFIGDFATGLFYNVLLLKISSLAYCLSYLCLIAVVSQKFKRIKFSGVLAAYLLIVFFINAYFLYSLFDILKTYIPDGLEVTLFAIKSITLIFLGFISFAVYLNSDTKKSILFLLMSLCFVFADVLYYISHYYLYNWSFVTLDRILHVAGLIFLFRYVIEVNRSRKKQMVSERISSNEIVA